MHGLSPLARGNRASRPFARAQQGAYPRSRGATAVGQKVGAFVEGLSPLARGNRRASSGRCRSDGPIPARAGQPEELCTHSSATRAYPRSRGATERNKQLAARIEGLSPLARGNPKRVPVAGALGGPIPARAGQPASSRRLARPSRAYPRSRGATGDWGLGGNSGGGLSPLARGNLDQRQRGAWVLGPIPARAGQPVPKEKAPKGLGAYPRSRGATSTV